MTLVPGVFRLEPHHEDPFDRLIVTPVTEERLALVTKDEAYAAPAD